MKKYVILALLDGEKTTWLAMGKNKNEILKYFLDNYNKRLELYAFKIHLSIKYFTKVKFLFFFRFSYGNFVINRYKFSRFNNFVVS